MSIKISRQETDTVEYFQLGGTWTKDETKAHRFDTIESAKRFAVDQKWQVNDVNDVKVVVDAKSTRSRELTDAEKNKADVLIEMFKESYANFDKRRTYEWKLSLAIWTALAVCIALALKGQARAFAPGLVVVGSFAILLQLFFIGRVKLANDVDKRRAELYEQEINRLTGIDFQDASWDGKTRVRTAIAKVDGTATGLHGLYHWFPNGTWAIVMHVGFTFLLLVAGCLVVGGKPTKSSNSQRFETMSWGLTTTTLDIKAP